MKRCVEMRQLVFTLLMAAAVIPAYAGEGIDVFTPGTIEYRQDERVPGVAAAVISGDPRKGYYTLRIKFAPGTKIQAHTHPDERTVTVLSGTYYLGVGARFDESLLQGYGPGTVVVVPAGTAHFVQTKVEEVIVQEAGPGPTGITLTE